MCIRCASNAHPHASVNTPNDQENSGRIPMVVTYHFILPSLGLTTRQYLYIPQTSEWLQRAFPLPPLIAFHCPKDLRDLLVRVELTPNVHTCKALGNQHCGAARCKTCPILMVKDEFTTHATGKQYRMRENTSCKLSKVIYLIKYKRCGHQDVGETGQPLQRSINSHRFDIVHQSTDESPVAMYLNNTAHSVEDMAHMVISCSPETTLCKSRQSGWIRDLRTTFP